MKRLALVLVVACGSSKDADPKPTSNKKPDPVMPDKPDTTPAAFKAWDLAARAKAWQGAWVVDHGGPALAIEVKGDQVTQWDGKAEKHLTFAVESPCSATFAEHKPDGSTETITTSYTLKAGKVVTGLGDAGSRNGKTAVACVSNKILVLDDTGKCVAWESFMGWKSEPAECGFSQKDGKEVFTAKVHGSDSTLQIDGDALMSEQLAGRSAPSFPDFAAAKAARDKG